MEAVIFVGIQASGKTSFYLERFFETHVRISRDTAFVAEKAGPACRFILLGSVATSKYLQPLLKILGVRLMFPSEFVGRGDMSRGGLLLRCARQKIELTYIPVLGAALHGRRPPRLPR